MPVSRLGLQALLVGLILAAGGCSATASTPDSKIVDALKLEHGAGGYEMAGDPFCTIAKLLNDGDEVSEANDHPGANGFVIAGPSGEVGVLAQRPFAPNCTRRAKEALRRLERKS